MPLWFYLDFLTHQQKQKYDTFNSDNKTCLAYMHDNLLFFSMSLFTAKAWIDSSNSSQRSLRAKPRDIYETNAGLSSDKDMNKNEWISNRHLSFFSM